MEIGNEKADVLAHPKFEIVFGKSSLQLKDLQDLDLRLLNQVHGSRVINASKKICEADGQWTDQPHQALVIKTADCLPIFIFEQGRIFALHAGWRGVKRRILTMALGMCQEPQKAQIFIGPHIQMRSFQLDRESALGLLKEQGLDLELAQEQSLARSSITQKNHFHISLAEIIRREAHAFGSKTVYVSRTDTFLSPLHNSYRRQRLNKQRNLSYIVLKG